MFRYLSFAAWLSVVALAACSFPTPYETYSPGSVTAPVQPQKAVTAYGFAVSPPQMAHRELPQPSEPTGASTPTIPTIPSSTRPATTTRPTPSTLPGQ